MERLPLIFIGHGSPMNALEDNSFTKTWKKIGNSLMAKPRAILMFSAHWITEGETRININDTPEMIYDMYGFPEELYRIRYSAPGDSEIAQEIIHKLSPDYTVIGDHTHGLDHGAWSTLIHVFPNADIPVIQISLDYEKSPEWHFEFGKKLRSLREEGILIIGSGNIVHNLRAIDWNGESIYPWAQEFDERIKKGIQEYNYRDILAFESWGDISRMAHPYYDHLLPLFPLLGAIDSEDQIDFFNETIALGSLAMRTIVWK